MKFFVISVFILLNSNIPSSASPYICDKSAVPCGCGPRNVGISARIVNGENSIPDSWSMIVSLRMNSTHPMHICGGTILSESYILTAAHCVSAFFTGEMFENLTVAAGIYNLSQSNQIIRKVDKITVHPLWKKFSTEYQYDIAVLHLSQPLDLSVNSSLSRTCLPPRQNTLEDIIEYPSNGTRLVIIGWGASELYGAATEVLQQVTVQAIHHFDKICSKTIRNPAVHLCAGLYRSLKGACKGDSGGPIFQWIGNRWEQVGIVSYGEGLCALENFPSVFTRVSYFHDWIQAQITVNPVIEDRNLYQCFAFFQSCGCSRRSVILSTSTTVESENALPHSWSMIVSISLRSTNEHLCSGTILENSFILTAAHCVQNRSAQDLVVKAGMYLLTESELITRQVNGLFLHPNYTQHFNDLAIIRLSAPLDAYDDKNISRSCLPSTENPVIQSNSSQLVLSGWNITDKMKSTHSLILQQAEIHTIDNCSVANGRQDLQFCAGQYGKGQEHVLSETCFGGDFGDPVFQWVNTRWLQVGIASHCETTSQLGVFTNLTKYQEWIQSTLMSSVFQTSHVYQCDREASCGCSEADVNITTSGVVKKESAVEHSWSMIVSIQSMIGFHRCAGSILSDSFILTAATCIRSALNDNRTTIVAGVSNLDDPTAIHRQIDQIYIHPNFSTSNVHDLAVIRLNHPLPVDPKQTRLSKTCVPTEKVNHPTANTSLVLLGWDGYLAQNGDGNILQQMSVKSVDPMHPSCFYRVSLQEYQCCMTPVTNEKFLDSSSACSTATTSGGPVFMYTNKQWEQVGIITDEYQCFTDTRARTFTRLSPYHEWIQQITNLSFGISSKPTEAVVNATASSVTTPTTSNGRNGMNSQFQDKLIFQIVFLLIILFS